MRTSIVLTLGLGLTLGLAGCSASSEAAPPTCDAADISGAISTSIAPQEVLIGLDSFECSGDFSYAFATTGPADGNSDGQIGVTIVLRHEGDAWVVQDRAAVCGTAQVTDGPAPYPTDAAVPEDIWQNACQTN